MATKWDNQPDQKNAIIAVIDAMAMVDAKWSIIHLELLRHVQMHDSVIREIPSIRTMERWVCKKYDCKTFVEYKTKRLDFVKGRLKHKAISMALSGNVVMLIFCLQNLCGWNDQPKFGEGDNKKEFSLAYNPNEEKEED